MTVPSSPTVQLGLSATGGHFCYVFSFVIFCGGHLTFNEDFFISSIMSKDYGNVLIQHFCGDGKNKIKIEPRLICLSLSITSIYRSKNVMHSSKENFLSSFPCFFVSLDTVKYLLNVFAVVEHSLT